MEPLVEAALRDAAAKAFIVDADCVTLPEFAKAVDAITISNGQVNSASVAAALAEMQRLKPNLFAPWEGLNDGAFAERERAFRRGLSSSRPFLPPIPKGLDYSALSQDDFDKADRYLRGVSNDDSVFRRHTRNGDGA